MHQQTLSKKESKLLISKTANEHFQTYCCDRVCPFLSLNTGVANENEISVSILFFRKLYVCLLIVFCIAVAATLTFFFIPRSVKLTFINVTSLNISMNPKQNGLKLDPYIIAKVSKWFFCFLSILHVVPL